MDGFGFDPLNDFGPFGSTNTTIPETQPKPDANATREESAKAKQNETGESAAGQKSWFQVLKESMEYGGRDPTEEDMAALKDMSITDELGLVLGPYVATDPVLGLTAPPARAIASGVASGASAVSSGASAVGSGVSSLGSAVRNRPILTSAALTSAAALAVAVTTGNYAMLGPFAALGSGLGGAAVAHPYATAALAAYYYQFGLRPPSMPNMPTFPNIPSSFGITGLPDLSNVFGGGLTRVAYIIGGALVVYFFVQNGSGPTTRLVLVGAAAYYMVS